MSTRATLGGQSALTPLLLLLLGPLRLAARLWHTLVRVHRAVEATSWGRLLLMNAWPAYLFALPLGARLMALYARWAEADRHIAAQGILHYRVALAQDVVVTLFMALVVLLFAIRRPVVGRRADWRAGTVALTGTFILNVVGLLSIPHDASINTLLASTAIVVAGTLFTCWSLLALGRCFGLLPEARGLVTRGPYRWVRHPVYVGEIISGFGIVLVKPHLATVLLYALFILFQYWRAVLEERALREVFPHEYDAYRARTGRLLPQWR